MKRNFYYEEVFSIICAVAIAATFVGCNKNSENIPETPEETTATEIVTEETTIEATTETTTVPEETEATTEFTFETIPEDQIPSFWIAGDNGDVEIKYADYDNEYVKKLREVYGGDQYPGLNIVKGKYNGKTYWYFCYTGDKTEGKVFYGYPMAESSDSIDWDYVNSRIDIFRKDVESGKVSAVDLDGDGSISNGELETCAIYCDKEYTIVGCSWSID